MSGALRPAPTARILGGAPRTWHAGPSAVTIGKFGGVHRGHRALIGELVEAAGALGVVPAALTFDRHPLAVLAPDRVPPEIVSQRRQHELLAQAGVRTIAVAHFDRAFAALDPSEFASEYLVGGLGARLVVVGAEFRFGRGDSGDVDLLRELGRRFGFDVRVARLVTDAESGPKLSSTTVRRALLAGDVGTAARVLGRWHDVSGLVVHGERRGRDLGFPTANLGPGVERGTGREIGVENLVPADGVYAGWLEVLTEGYGDESAASDGRGRTVYPTAVSVGENPTFADVSRVVEAHVIGRSGLDLYGLEARVHFVRRLRGMVAFEGVGPLVAQMHADVDDASDILREAPLPEF